jgi:hypothetical protein
VQKSPPAATKGLRKIKGAVGKRHPLSVNPLFGMPYFIIANDALQNGGKITGVSITFRKE